MELSWIGSTIVAIVGLVGVVVTAVVTSRSNVARLRFEADQRERERQREERQEIAAGVEHIATTMDAAQSFAETEPPLDYTGPPFDLQEEWPDWWASRKSRLRREVARIHDDQARRQLGDVAEALTYAFWIEHWGPGKRSGYDVIRSASRAGFEVASAWLRGESVNADWAAEIVELHGEVDQMLEAIADKPWAPKLFEPS